MTATLTPRVHLLGTPDASELSGEHLELIARPWTFRIAAAPLDRISVRLAGVRDLPALARLHRHCSARSLLDRYHRGGRPPTAAALEAELREPFVFVASHRDGSVIATAAVRTAADHGRHAAEVSLLVADAWQRRGVGSTLLSHLAGVAHVGGHTELVAYPATAVAAAQRLMIEIGRTRMVPDARTRLHTYLREDATLGLGTVRQRLAG